jgi:phosphatidylserine/phosphatidylglycerophosphate/cardiolipin synthase-like enzyme
MPAAGLPAIRVGVTPARLIAALTCATLLLGVPAGAEAAFGASPGWQVCFAPGQDCTSVIVAQIDGARSSIRVQAYSFTSTPILAALKRAHDRGIDVRVIVDKTSAGKQRSGSNYTAATYLTNASIPVWVDTKVAIAHNKVMVIDAATVITGSFNFTVAAQKRNAENLLVIQDRTLAQLYGENWDRRRAVSQPYGPGVAVTPGGSESE